MNYNDFKTQMESKFVQAESEIQLLYYALFSKGKHVLFYGPPGHAKTEMAEEAIKIKLNFEGLNSSLSNYYLAQCSAATPLSTFNGYVNVKTLRETGRREVESGDTIFMKHKYVILDEGLDLPLQVLESLKSVLTSGHLCDTSYCLPTKVNNIILCTNVNPFQWATTPSLRAVLDRFAYIKEVKWQDYSPKAFDEMFRRRHGYTDPVVSEMMAEAHKMSYPITPRSANKMFIDYQKYGIDALNFQNGVTSELFEVWRDIDKTKPYISQAQKLIREINDLDETSFSNGLKALSLLGQLSRLTIPSKAPLFSAVNAASKILKQKTAAISKLPTSDLKI
jgi:DNA polymerase III delta prime subunit